MTYIDQERRLGLDQYPKAVANRIRTHVDRSQLELFGGEHTGKIIRPYHLPTDAYPAMPNAEDPLKAAEMNVKYPKAIEALLLAAPGAKEDAYMRGIGGIDLHHLPHIALELATKGGKASGTIMRTVYGATTEMPMRAIGYSLPAIQLQRQLLQAGIEPPQLQLISANNMGAFINKTDYGKSHEQAVLLAEKTRAMIQHKFPEVADYVVFLEDMPVGEDLYAELKNTAEAIREHGGAEILARLHGRANGSEDTSPLYGAAHLPVHDREFYDNLKPLVPYQPDLTPAQTIMSVGSSQETLFYDLRQAVKPHLPAYNEVKTVQYFTNHHTPPYIPARGGDILMSQMDNLPTTGAPAVDATARYDINYLMKIAGGLA